jgi:hypothetical protein
VVMTSKAHLESLRFHGDYLLPECFYSKQWLEKELCQCLKGVHQSCLHFVFEFNYIITQICL